MLQIFASGRAFLFATVALFAVPAGWAQDDTVAAVVSVADQRMAVLRGGNVIAKYPVSTSKFGLGDARGSYKTPLGRLRVCEKVGDDLAAGAVMKGREATGEILPVNAAGRDPIVTRILWLEGMEEQNRNARARAIYIHGTPEERQIGKPVSWGCIRMRSEDVIELHNELQVGSTVTIIEERLPHFPKGERRPLMLASTSSPARSVSAPVPVQNKPSLKLTKDAPSDGRVPTSFRSEPLFQSPSQSMRDSILLSGLNDLSTAPQ